MCAPSSRQRPHQGAGRRRDVDGQSSSAKGCAIDRLGAIAGWVNRTQVEVIDYLKEENRILREQMDGRRGWITDDQRRRLAARGKVLGRQRLHEVTSLLTPDTILRWYRELIAEEYDGAAKRRPGRPSTAVRLKEMVVKLAMENAGWRYTRLRGALRNLGRAIGRNTIKRILKDHGIQPAPERSKRLPWQTFLKAHFGVEAATDSSWSKCSR
jgi:transposase